MEADAQSDAGPGASSLEPTRPATKDGEASPSSAHLKWCRYLASTGLSIAPDIIGSIVRSLPFGLILVVSLILVFSNSDLASWAADMD